MCSILCKLKLVLNYFMSLLCYVIRKYSLCPPVEMKDVYEI